MRLGKTFDEKKKSSDLKKIKESTGSQLSAILDLFGSNQFMSCPQGLSFFWRLCPALFPPVRVSGYILLGVTWRLALFIESPVIP